MNLFRSVFFALFFLALTAVAEETSNASLQIIGNPNVAVGSSGGYLNFGGPNLKLDYGDFNFGLSFYPSLRLSNNTISPTLGAGPYLGYKKFVLSVPLYYIATQWTAAFGIGYRL